MADILAVSRLIARVSKEDFGSEALALISSVARIENFGAFVIADIGQPEPVLTFWSGRISDYWFERQADVLLDSPEAYQHVLEEITAAEDGQLSIERWHPPEGDPRWDIYQKNGIIERIAVPSAMGGLDCARSICAVDRTDG